MKKSGWVLYLFEDEDIDLSRVFTNLSFNTGINCDHEEEMKYLAELLPLLFGSEHME